MNRPMIAFVLTSLSVMAAAQERGSGAAVEPGMYILNFEIDDVNSVGGVDVWFVLGNPMPTPMKYMRIRATPFNAVGDRVYSEIGRESTVTLEFTGPLRNEDGYRRADWGPVWYNSTVSCVRVDAFTVIFMDGKSKTFSGKALRSAIGDSAKNDCSVRKK